MTKTLADMTAKEREACVGMWCEAKEYGTLLVIARIKKDSAQAAVTQGLYPYEAPLKYFTPRFDLPRAWNPDGTPPEWDWQYADYTPGMNRGFYLVDEIIEKDRELLDGVTRARRPVGEWEEAND